MWASWVISRMYLRSCKWLPFAYETSWLFVRVERSTRRVSIYCLVPAAILINSTTLRHPAALINVRNYTDLAGDTLRNLWIPKLITTIVYMPDVCNVTNVVMLSLSSSFTFIAHQYFTILRNIQNVISIYLNIAYLGAGAVCKGMVKGKPSLEETYLKSVFTRSSRSTSFWFGLDVE